MWKRLIDRAKRLAEERLPAGVVEAGRRVGQGMLEKTVTVAHDHDSTAQSRAPEYDQSIRARPNVAAEEPPQVVVYATSTEASDVAAIRRIFHRYPVVLREINLEQDPKTARQMAITTGVMVPPYVYIEGRFWGARYDIESLDADGDITKILAGDFAGLSDAAKRVGRVRESFSDAMTIDNIRDRLGRGHILCIDDLDCWQEEDDGARVLFYEGGRHLEGEIDRLIRAIAARIESGEVEATWRLEPEVKV